MPAPGHTLYRQGTLLLSLLAGLLAACPGGGGGDGGLDAAVDGPVDAPADDGSDAAGVDSGLDVGPGDATSPPDSSGPRIEIGVGVTEFVPFEDDAPIELTAGPQGGYHVNVTLRFWGLEADDLLIGLEGWDDASDTERTVPVDRVLTRRRVIVSGDHFDRVGERLIFTTFTPEEVVGLRLRVEATATPLDGPPVTDVAYGVVVDEE